MVVLTQVFWDQADGDDRMDLVAFISTCHSDNDADICFVPLINNNIIYHRLHWFVCLRKYFGILQQMEELVSQTSSVKGNGHLTFQVEILHLTERVAVK